MAEYQWAHDNNKPNLMALSIQAILFPNRLEEKAESSSELCPQNAAH